MRAFLHSKDRDRKEEQDVNLRVWLRPIRFVFPEQVVFSTQGEKVNCGSFIQLRK